MNEEERESSKNLRRLGPAFAFLKPYKWQVIIASVALIVTASATLSLGQGIRMVIDSGFASGEIEMLTQSLMLFVTFIVVLTIGTFVRFYFVSWVGERVSADIRLAVFDHLVHMHPGYFEDNAPSEIQSRITTDTTLIQSVIGSSASIALRNLLMMIGGTLFLFITNPKLTSVVLLCIPLVIGPIMFFGRKVRRLSRDSQDEIANVGAYVGESIQQIKTVQAYNQQTHNDGVFSRYVETAFDVAKDRIFMRSVLITIVMTLVFGALAAMIWVGGQDVISGRMSAGELTAFVAYAVIVATAVGAISQVISELQRAAGAMERLVELLEAESHIQAPAVPTQLQGAFNGQLEFESVSFAYPLAPTPLP